MTNILGLSGNPVMTEVAVLRSENTIVYFLLYSIAVKCIDVGLIDNANRHITGSGSDYNNHAKFICHSSYRLLGNAERTCGKTSTWSGEQPICLRE